MRLEQDATGAPYNERSSAFFAALRPAIKLPKAKPAPVKSSNDASAKPDSGAKKPTGITPPALRPNQALTGASLLLDPGHGAADSPGVKGPTGLQEASIVLDVAKRLRTLLDNAGARVYMTRETALSPLTNKQRAEAANRLKVDIFIRIHAETYPDSLASGVEALWAKDASKPLAETLINDLSAGTGLVSLGANKISGYEGLINANVPSVQVSVGALSNQSNETFLARETNRQRVAESLYRGIVKYVHAR